MITLQHYKMILPEYRGTGASASRFAKGILVRQEPEIRKREDVIPHRPHRPVLSAGPSVRYGRLRKVDRVQVNALRCATGARFRLAMSLDAPKRRRRTADDQR